MNLRKDHYRLLVFTDLLQLKPPRVSGRAAFGSLVRALELRLACRCSQRLRLTARSHVGRLGEDGPRLPRYRTPFERLLELWDVQRFKELPPRPGFVISPPRWEVQLTHAFALLTKSLWTSVRESKTQHYTVDHLARGSMKNGANSVMPCELQDT